MFVTGAARRGAGGNGICALAAKGPSRNTAPAHNTDNNLR